MPDSTGPDILRGTLDLLILKTLSTQPMHGWGISQQIQERSKGLLEVNQGSIYPALQRLQHKGWITASWGTSDNNRRAKYYALTSDGTRGLESETAEWRRYIGVVDTILEGA